MIESSFDRRRHPDGASFTTWEAPDGWRYRRMDWPQEDSASARGSLIYAGGRGDFIEKYLEALGHWHDRGWNVTSFDWRGQGASRGGIKGGHLDSLDILVDDLAALIADRRQSLPQPHVVVAHSMGGHVLLRALAEQRVDLDAAVLVAPMLQINSGPLPGVTASWTASLLAGAGLKRQAAWPQFLPEPNGSFRQDTLTSCSDRYRDELWWWEREPGFDLGAPSWGWIDAAYRSCAAVTDEKLASLETPLLIVATECDRLVSAEAIRSAAATLPNAALQMFSTAGHEILREADGVRLEALARIDSFLDETAPSP
jgi:lysophospholipase